MKQKDFVFNLCLLIFLNLLVKPFWMLGVDVGVQNSVPSILRPGMRGRATNTPSTCCYGLSADNGQTIMPSSGRV